MEEWRLVALIEYAIYHASLCVPEAWQKNRLVCLGAMDAVRESLQVIAQDTRLGGVAFQLRDVVERTMAQRCAPDPVLLDSLSLMREALGARGGAAAAASAAAARATTPCAVCGSYELGEGWECPQCGSI